MPALARNYTVIAPDLRGLGDTTAEDIYQLVSQLKLGQKIYLVGHDIGVHTAYSYAAIHPNNVSKLVILNFRCQDSIQQVLKNATGGLVFIR
jgi:pimeloyl-ACP methyl ester carboxylesterase